MLRNKFISSKNIKNTIWNLLEVVLSPLLFFISIPLFLEFLGEERFGVWMLLNAIILIMQALNLGLNISTYKHLSEAVRRQDWVFASNSLNTNVSLTILLTFIVGSVLFCIGLGIEYKEWFIETQTSKNQVLEVLVLCPFIVLVKFIEQIFYNVFRAFEEFKYVTWISLCVKVLTVGINLILAYYIQSIFYIFCCIGLISAFGIGASYILIKRKIPGYTFSFLLQAQFIRNEIKFALYTWLQSIAVIVVYQGDRLLVSHGFGVVTLSYYSVVATLFNHIHMGLTALTPWLFPQIVKAQEQGKAYVENLYINVRNIGIVASVILVLCFSLISEPLMILWLGKDTFIEIEMYLKWLTIFQFFFIFSIAPYFFMNASGQEKRSLKLVLMFTGLNVVGMLIGYMWFFTVEALLIGLSISTAIGMIAMHAIIETTLHIKSNFKQLSFMFLPSIFGVCSVLSTEWWKWIWALICLISLYIIYFKMFKTEFKKIL